MRDDKDLSEIRTIIARHKLWDLIFMIVGVLALMIAVLTFMALFAHMLIEGMGFFYFFPVAPPGVSGHTFRLGRHHSGHAGDCDGSGADGYWSRNLSGRVCV